MDYLSIEEQVMLDQMLDDVESLKSILAQANLTFAQAKDKVAGFIEHAKSLCTTYSLPLDNKATFCQLLYKRIDSSPKQDMLWLYTAVLADKGLLFDIDRTSRTIEQDIRCYLDMNQKMALLSEELNLQTTYKTAFNRLKQQTIRYDASLSVITSEDDAHFVFNLCLTHLPELEATDILMNNIILLCSMINNNEDLLRIAPFFIYQVTNRHTSRLGNTEDFYFEIGKLWSNKKYQIINDNGKNFKRYLALLNFYLNLCNYFSQNPAVDFELCHYCFAETSNLCEWYYNHCEDNEDVQLPVPLAVRIAQANIYCCENSPDYGCSPEELDAFWEMEKAVTQFERKMGQYLRAHPSVIQEYIDNLSGSKDKNRHLVYRIFENADLPRKYITPTNLPLIYTVINLFLDIEINLQAEATLLQIGKRLINSETGGLE